MTNMHRNLVATCLIPSVFSQPLAPVKESPTINFMYVAPITEAGWVCQHEDERKVV